MQLKISENIKKYRKSMGMTQEGLAEAFGVTVGAVSKWESGSTVPDILTMMEIADFFDISVDTLLGYSISSKGVKDIVKEIDASLSAGQYDEALLKAEKALARYPGNFKVLTGCADAYMTCWGVFRKPEHRDRAIKLFEEALRYVDQGGSDEDNELTIRYKIAEMNIRDNPLKSIRELEQINYRGASEIALAQAYMSNGQRDKSLDHYTRALSALLFQAMEFASGMAATLNGAHTREGYREATECMDWLMAVMDASSIGKVSYLTKMKAFALALKAINLSCLEEYDRMREAMDQALALAREYDKNPANDLVGKIRFWHAEDYRTNAYDNLGYGTVEGVGLLFVNIAGGKDNPMYEKMAEARKYWNEIANIPSGE